MEWSLWKFLVFFCSKSNYRLPYLAFALKFYIFIDRVLL